VRFSSFLTFNDHNWDAVFVKRKITPTIRYYFLCFCFVFHAAHHDWVCMYFMFFLYIAQVVLQFFVFRTWKNVVCMIGREKKTETIFFCFWCEIKEGEII